MFEALGRNRNLVAVGLLILAPLVVYRANARQAAEANPLEKLVLTLTSPIERSISFGVDAVSDIYARYVDAIGARAQNIELRAQLRRASVDADRAEALERENDRLRQLLEIRERNPTLNLIAGTVIAAGRSAFSQAVRVDRGQVHGVVRGAPVLSEAGLVGRVQRVGFVSSEVLLLTDERVTVDVTIARSRVRGRLRGGRVGGGFGLRIRGLLRTDDVRPGDLLVTSGLAGVFPHGLVVGRIEKVETRPGAQEPDVEVRADVDFDRLDEVLIVLGHDAEEEPVFTPPELLPSPLRPDPTATSSAAAASGGE